ncbi:hypothetical protein [Halobaculum sp. P14]|uniref:hypothetical protein n=1 Tax=Halobaculum sp. P14 TaxID=3421638 RepID=UPI003EC050E5
MPRILPSVLYPINLVAALATGLFHQIYRAKNRVVDCISKLLLRWLCTFHEGIDELLKSNEEWLAGQRAVKGSVSVIAIFFVLAWVIDAATLYRVNNTVYGLAVSGTSGIVATGADLLEKQSGEFPGISAEVHKVIGFLGFGAGFFLQITVLFLQYRPLTFIPHVGPGQLTTSLYWVLGISIFLFSTSRDFLRSLAFSFVVTLTSVVFGIAVYVFIGEVAGLLSTFGVYIALIIYWLSITILVPIFRGIEHSLSQIATPHEAEPSEKEN